jgi:hypothetical protein
MLYSTLQSLYRTHALVNLDTLMSNLNLVRAYIPKTTQIMAGAGIVGF